MIALIILFVISLLSLSVMILYKYWRLRMSESPVHGADLPHLDRHPLTAKDVLVWRDKAWDQTKKHTHTAILNTIKTGIVVTHVVQKKLRTKFPKIFKERPEVDTKPNSSFLKTVADYKTKIKRFKKKIKEQDL